MENEITQLSPPNATNGLSQRLTELEGVRAKLAVLEKAIKQEMEHELAQLPSRYGFDSAQLFVQAVLAACGQPRTTVRETGRRRRARVTDATTSTVAKMVKAGETGADIAKSLNVSMSTVQNIKRRLGLIKSR